MLCNPGYERPGLACPVSSTSLKVVKYWFALSDGGKLLLQSGEGEGGGGGGTGRIKLPAQKKPMQWLYPNCYYFNLVVFYYSNTNTNTTVIVFLKYFNVNFKLRGFQHWKIFCMIWEHFKTQSLYYSSQPFWVILCWAFVSIIAHHVLTDLLWSNHKGIFTSSCDNMKIRKILREKKDLFDNFRIFMRTKLSSRTITQIFSIAGTGLG